jgi:hypothetical protein
MQARLKVLHDKANVKQVKLLPVTLIGRSTECNLKIASSQVSRVHCRITLGDDTVFVEDLGSANGTLLDGQPLPPLQPTSIAPGTRIIIGPAEFQIDYVAATSATLVLPRTGVPPIPEMPSTEMIFPVTPIAEDFSAPAPAAAPAHTVAAIAVPPAAEPDVQSTVIPPISSPTAPPAAAVPAVAVPVAVPAVAVPAVAVPAVAVPVAVPAAMPVRPAEQVPVEATTVALNGHLPTDDEATFVMPPAATDDTVFLDAPLDFAENLAGSEVVNEFNFSNQAVDEANEATQFMFTETMPDSFAASDRNPATATEPSPKTGGLKSLFSIFGRKEKASSGTAPATTGATQPASPPPSVFLPAMDVQTVDANPMDATTVDAQVDVQSPEPEIAYPAEPFQLEDTASVPAESAETVVIEGESAPETSTEDDDGFQQFLSQL